MKHLQASGHCLRLKSCISASKHLTWTVLHLNSHTLQVIVAYLLAMPLHLLLTLNVQINQGYNKDTYSNWFLFTVIYFSAIVMFRACAEAQRDTKVFKDCLFIELRFADCALTLSASIFIFTPGSFLLERSLLIMATGNVPVWMVQMNHSCLIWKCIHKREEDSWHVNKYKICHFCQSS